MAPFHPRRARCDIKSMGPLPDGAADRQGAGWSGRQING